MKKSHLLCLGIPLLALSGCTPNGSPPDAVRGIAASYLAGRAFDRAQAALERNNHPTVQSAGEDLRRAAQAGSNPQVTSRFIGVLVAQASNLNLQANESKGDERDRLLNESDEAYRIALGFTPTQDPGKTLDPVTLNALGYFLADRGSSPQDFERAVVLTRAALNTWPVGSGASASFLRVSKALGPQDSYAWALFKLGRYSEAQIQAEEVLKIAQEGNQTSTDPEIPFHLAEIYRAVGEKDKARTAYEAASRLSPSAELQSQIKSGVLALEFKQV
jgi:tetratricopeptide (TPR) repeat protein